MAKKLRSLDDASLDVFHALRRALMQKGFVRRWPYREALSAKAKTEDSDAEDRYMEETKQEKAPISQKGLDDQQKATKDTGANADSPAAEAPDQDPERLLDMTTNAQHKLFEASTVFPLNLFPDTITVDREKVTVANRYFYRVAKINSTPIADLQSVEADVGPFFGTVKLTSKYFINNTRELHFLWRNDAIKVQRLLQGYIIATQREIDCNTIDTDQLRTLLLDLGQGASD